jgi:hypothetical protein
MPPATFVSVAKFGGSDSLLIRYGGQAGFSGYISAPM